jgi:hypothetical protein
MIMTGIDMIGPKTGIALLAGGIAVLVGTAGVALSLVLARQSAPERGKSRHILLAVGSALLLSIGGLVLLGAGIMYPLIRISRTPPLYLGEVEYLTKLHTDEYIQNLLKDPKYSDPKKLTRYAYKIYSNDEDDGSIAEIIRRVGTSNRYFVEFGAGAGFNGNTTLLLRQGWTGLWIEANGERVKMCKDYFRPEIEEKKLTAMEAFITAENIEQLFAQANVPEEFDLLSIDIDRNDYYIWNGIHRYKPRVVIIEYNALFPPPISWVVPYDANAWWDRTTRWGASLKALEELGKKKGYSLVGCNLSGSNAYFVRDDLVGDHFAAPYTAEHHYEPPRYYLYHHDFNHSTRLP